MDAETSLPTVRELIAEYAAIEDRRRLAEAQDVGGSAHTVNPDLRELAERERQILAMLRRHESALRKPSSPPGSVSKTSDSTRPGRT